MYRYVHSFFVIYIYICIYIYMYIYIYISFLSYINNIDMNGMKVSNKMGKGLVVIFAKHGHHLNNPRGEGLLHLSTEKTLRVTKQTKQNKNIKKKTKQTNKTKQNKNIKKKTKQTNKTKQNKNIKKKQNKQTKQNKTKQKH